MKLFRIKIELIALILLALTTIAGFMLQLKFMCWQTITMFLISLLILLIMCFNYNTIKDLRKEIIRRW